MQPRCSPATANSNRVHGHAQHRAATKTAHVQAPTATGRVRNKTRHTTQSQEPTLRSMSPYHSFVLRFAQLLQESKSYPVGDTERPSRPGVSPDAPRVLLFSPHPDDECLAGVLPLRLLREAGMNVLNVAVTLGSRKERRAARLEELKRACEYLGYGLIPTGPDGLERISPGTRVQDPAHWRSCTEAIAKIIALYQPGVIFLPHAQDWHPTHVGTHLLVMDALNLQLSRFSCYVVETEYWCTMPTPNLLVEANEDHVGDLVTALSFHEGEVARNPYHVSLPALLHDNVRRGAELVGGCGTAAPDYLFGGLYRLRKWAQNQLTDVLAQGKFVPRKANLGMLFA